MKILRLAAENVKRLSAVEIRPDGHVVTIGGKNGAGKSSVLDSIAYALGGEKLIPGQPVRKGQDKAKITIDLDDLVVTRTFTAAGGGTLVVANKEGARYPSPQAILDKLVGRLSFDPLAFARMEPPQQRDTLRRLAGLDFTALDKQRLELYNQRTEVNREGKSLESRLAATPSFAMMPEQEQNLTAITTELAAANAAAAVVAQLQGDVAACRDAHLGFAVSLRRMDEQIATLEQALADARALRVSELADFQKAEGRLEEYRTRLEEAKAAVPDLLALRTKLEAIESTNEKVRANAKRADAAKAVEDNKQRAEQLTAEIASVDKQKVDAIAAATFPIPGLAVTDAGVTFGEIPFEQASTAEQLRVSVAVGLALNPKLKVLLVRDGSALDTDGLALMAQMAAAADAQVWIERVTESRDGVSVLIEDGAVHELAVS